MKLEKVINALKNDSDLRQGVIDWINATDPAPVIREWWQNNWSEVGHYDIQQVISMLPEGYRWKVVETNTYYLTLDYHSFDNDYHRLELSAVCFGTSYGDLRLDHVSFIEQW